METYTLAAFITLCTCLFTFFLAFNVGAMRRKHKTSVLDIKQSKDVIIANRVHMNQIENMVVFLPIFWVATIYGPIKIVGMIGVIWFLSRVAYAYMYMKSPNKREKPFIVGVICIVILAVLGLYGLVF